MDVFSLFYNIWINPQTEIFKLVQYLLKYSNEKSHTWCRYIRKLACMYEIRDPLDAIADTPQSKREYSAYISTKITVYHERQLREASKGNSKMVYLNIQLKGLNGQIHSSLKGISSSNKAIRSRAHIKMLCNDLQTQEEKTKHQGGSPYCLLCSKPKSNIENLCHIIAKCDCYNDIRQRIIHQIEIICATAATKINFKLILSNDEWTTQFILDCTSVNLPVRISTEYSYCQRIFELSRDLCYQINKTRCERLEV